MTVSRRRFSPRTGWPARQPRSHLPLRRIHDRRRRRVGVVEAPCLPWSFRLTRRSLENHVAQKARYDLGRDPSQLRPWEVSRCGPTGLRQRRRNLPSDLVRYRRLLRLRRARQPTTPDRPHSASVPSTVRSNPATTFASLIAPLENRAVFRTIARFRWLRMPFPDSSLISTKRPRFRDSSPPSLTPRESGDRRCSGRRSSIADSRAEARVSHLVCSMPLAMMPELHDTASGRLVVVAVAAANSAARSDGSINPPCGTT